MWPRETDYRSSWSPEGCWADPASDGEFGSFRAVKGDRAWQAEWELLAILISLHVFHS